MVSKSSTTTIALIIIFLIASLARADLFLSPSPATTNDFGTCPRNPTQLGVCTNVLRLANVTAGDTRARPCCSAINGLPNIQVADCLCYLFRPLPLVFSLDEAVREIFFACNMIFPIGFQCPPPSTAITP
ncbi:unnamed protein product [Microthlaspi erraticum]|uniref:Bifunctional inhibitor/plant lipid transfer protein/seed storage helical domain-containing protein n=1 Tax=Microthlaspi erraticum TaxID=1685480 RepID=A0A6D2KE52_9BRAS|nr:unnamed protein product [Microthlaspi erraticum]CAA7046418.1 unnamed protein product [Microthlaspi erraticum]